jgi:UDP-glucose 4-epimerase
VDQFSFAITVEEITMSKILITGTSGFIGQALAAALAGQHEVIGFSRKPTEIAGVAAIAGDFAEPAELHKLDAHPNIDVLVHLAAVTGGCSEEDGIRVNVAGTHHLLRYLIDRGTRKFVLASSIAAVGMQSLKFRPRQLPMPDEHPCLDRDGYGLSKYLMEEVTRYLAR